MGTHDQTPWLFAGLQRQLSHEPISQQLQQFEQFLYVELECPNYSDRVNANPFLYFELCNLYQFLGHVVLPEFGL